MTEKTGKSFCLGLANALLLTFALPVSATTPTEIAKLVANDAAEADGFGWAVAVDGDTAVVGAIQNDATALNGGAAYVFTRSGGTWTQRAKLTASDPAIGAAFGYSVALNGDTALIGTVGVGAYVFTRHGTTWTQQAKLGPGDPTVDNSFGASVALDGETVVVGALRGDNNAFNSGLAYVFTRSGMTWTQQARLAASDVGSK